VSRYQKGKNNLDFAEARDSEWQWHQLGHMQACTSLQTDNHASTPPLKCFTGRMPNQQLMTTLAARRRSVVWWVVRTDAGVVSNDGGCVQRVIIDD